MGDERLFEIFSEKIRINPIPQIFAGNLLYDRGFNKESLVNAKNELIETIEDTFNKIHNQVPRKIKTQNVLVKVLIAVLLFSLAYRFLFSSDSEKVSLIYYSVDRYIVMIFIGTCLLMPFLWIRKSNQRAIKKVENEVEKKNNLIRKINTELKF